MNESRSAQIGKDVTGYDTNLGQMPGWRMNLPGFTEVSGDKVSWAIAILSSIDELDAYDWFRTDAGTANWATISAVQSRRLDRYICPTFAYAVGNQLLFECQCRAHDPVSKPFG